MSVQVVHVKMVQPAMIWSIDIPAHAYQGIMEQIAKQVSNSTQFNSTQFNSTQFLRHIMNL